MNAQGVAKLAALIVVIAQVSAFGQKMLVIGGDPPKTVVKKYFIAITNNDVNGAKALSAGDAGNQLIAFTGARMTQSMMRITNAWAQRHSSVVLVNNMPFDLYRPDLSVLDKMTERITGDTASVQIPPGLGSGQGATIPLRKIEGVWKMDINATLKMPAERPEFVHGIDQITQAMDAEAAVVAAEVSAGKYAKFTDATADAMKRMEVAKLKKTLEVAAEIKRRHPQPVK